MSFIEVYLVEPGAGRPYFTHKPGALEFLSTDAPLPAVGDIILLPRNVTGDSEEDAFVMGLAAPFRVVEREHMYTRPPDEDHDPINTRGADHSKSWIFVRRVSKQEYAADPGSYSAVWSSDD